jgi:hypothetical protein
MLKEIRTKEISNLIQVFLHLIQGNGITLQKQYLLLNISNKKKKTILVKLNYILVNNLITN